ncbi:hypothetical protein LCGC14_1325490 [marine sediment metagenome]|uniref:Hemerythrin-like domain-containing protein n=1 Tax=marine sediment metagenome TaxID=412755 RepID=A0A0F9NKL7_9ZZZZ
MELKKGTKILPIIDKYPNVYDALYKLNSKVKRLKNPIARRTIGKKANLEMISDMLEIPLDKLISTIKSAIDASADEQPEKDRKEMLKKLLLDIHKGVDIEVLKAQFKEAVGDISAFEIGKLEQQLIDEGFLDPKEISKLSDLHVEFFRDALDFKADYDSTPGHPIHTYLQENLEIANLIRKIRSAKESDKFSLFQELKRVDVHYARKENQLFPIIEKHGIGGIPSVMWAVHDEIREILKTENVEEVEVALKKVEDMIYKEEHILFPLTLETFAESDWVDVRKGEEEIGFIFGVEPGNQWKPVSTSDIHELLPSEPIVGTKNLNLDIGNLTPEQINTMLKTLPVDLTFVDENDEVAYYSDTEDRIFPRSRGIIGRKVQKCHPPDSVDVVEDILQKFKSGEKNIAEFWIQLDGKFILIRYFAMRDEEENYVGTLEVSQEISHLRSLKDERRLVEWEK